MKFQRKYNIGRIASTDYTRPHLTSVFLDVENKRMYATDGRALAVVPCEVDVGDRSGMLPVEAVGRARRMKQPEIAARKRLARVGKEVMYTRPGASPVPVDSVIPKFKYGDAGTVSISLNPEFLLNAAKAIGRGKEFTGSALVTLTFQPTENELSPIVLSWEDEEAHAVLMPGRRR